MPSLTSMASALAITVLAGGLALPADAADPGPAEDVTARRLADRTPGGTPLGGQSAGDADAIAALRAARPGTVRLVVRVRDAAAVSRALRTTLSAGVESAIRLPELNAFSLVVPSQQADTVRRTLAARDDVTEVFAAHRRKFSDVPNDPDWVNQRAYLTTVSAPAAWDVTHGSTSARIAVIDSGIDTSHPDLAGKVVASYNAVTGTTSVNDTIGHGTEVASVAAANTNNSTGIAGAGFASMLLAVKVDDAAGDIWSDAVANGIRWAADNGADVINVSLGSTGDDALERDAVAYARSRGALVVAAAGNEGTSTPMYPAAYDGVIAVGATDQSGSARTSFSSYGTWVDVGAPGLNIRAAKAGGGLATVSGTSFAAPLVAGEAALLAAYPSQPTEPQLAAAIRAGTKGGALGFDRGLVDFRAAFNTLAPTSVPTITEPGSGSTISGTVRVTATSQAAKVRFSVGGTAATATPSVVDGTATATLPTYGLSGTQTVEATDCDQFGVCAATGHQISVTIANNPPVMTAPTQGATIGATTFTASVAAPGDAVRFTIDGKAVATDTTPPFSVNLSVSALAAGAHQVSALQCNTAGTVCDAARPAAARTIYVKRLRPAITSISANPFSPNRDGRRDTTTVAYWLDQTQTAVLRVKTSSGAVVFGPKTLGTLSAGSRTYTWNGKNNSGAAVASGTYTVELSTSAVTSGYTLRGLATRTVRVDVARPGLSSIQDSPSTVYPYPDGFLDSSRLYVTTFEPLSLLILEVYNSAGTRVRVINGWARSVAGRTYIVWNGRTGSGTIVAPGTYYYRFTAQDFAGNRTASGNYAIGVSAKRLVQKTGTKYLTPYGTVTSVLVGNCSAVVNPGRTEWTYSLGYYSNYNCVGYGSSDDLAAAIHGYTLPAATKYGTVRVDTYGGRAVPGYPDTATLLYVDRNGQFTSTGKVLGAADGTYYGPTVAASGYLVGGRTVKWVTATVDMNWYDVKLYRVVWTYYVLV